MGEVDNGEGYACVRGGNIQSISVSCPQFCYKTTLKIQSTENSKNNLSSQCPSGIKIHKLTGRNSISALLKEDIVRLAINVKSTTNFISSVDGTNVDFLFFLLYYSYARCQH